MACLSKLDDRQLKDLEEKLKYILIIRKTRRRCVLRDKMPRKAWMGHRIKQKCLWRFFKAIQRTPCRPRVITLCLLYFKNTNFRTHKTSASFEISYRNAVNITQICYSKYCDKADKSDSNTIRAIRKRSHYAISTISYYRITIIALIAKWAPRRPASFKSKLASDGELRDPRFLQCSPS